MAIYGTLSGANSFFSANDLSGLWATYTDANKNKALQRATEEIDTLSYKGEKYEHTQDLSFPRVFYTQQRVIYFDLNTSGNVVVPPKIINTVYLQAKFLLETLSNDAIESIKYGISSRSIGSTSESYNLDRVSVFDLETELCREALRLIKPFLIIGY